MNSIKKTIFQVVEKEDILNKKDVTLHKKAPILK